MERQEKEKISERERDRDRQTDRQTDRQKCAGLFEISLN
jgi:hypothetical protein